MNEKEMQNLSPEESDKVALATSEGGVKSRDGTLFERLWEVIYKFCPLGFVAFGGPTAHIALMHTMFVERGKWLDEDRFLELFAIGSALPGPTSTQMVVAMGATHAGIPGGLAALLLWSLPSLIIMILTGLGVDKFIEGEPNWMSGLAPAATSLVFVACWKLSAKVVDSQLKIILTIISSIVTVLVTSEVDSRGAAIYFPVSLVVGGLVTLADAYFGPDRQDENGVSEPRKNAYLKKRAETSKETQPTSLTSKITSTVLIVIWAVVFGTVVAIRAEMDNGNMEPNDFLMLFESMYRMGSIIYGGGQVVLPMLLTEVVETGWVTADEFFQGFAVVQALPGPLFNFSAYLGAVYKGFAGAMTSWIGLFSPGVLLIFAFIPFWDFLRKFDSFQIFLAGVNASAIGFVAAACVVMWEVTVDTPADASCAILCGSLVASGKVPAPIAIIAGGLLGWLLSDDVINGGQSWASSS